MPGLASLALGSLGMVLLAGCRTPSVSVPAWLGPEPEQVVAEIREAGRFAAGELDVQPLRDSMVEDLRAKATGLERRQQYAEAAAALDQAIGLSPDDPALLQERAEIAVLQRDLERAASLAQRGFEIGAKVGPLCRRHWATIRQAHALRQRRSQAFAEASAARRPLEGEALAQWTRESQTIAAALADAERRQADCTLTGPPRY